MGLKLKPLAHMYVHVDVLLSLWRTLGLCATTVCVAAYMRPCVWMCTYVYMFCSPLHLTSFAPVAAWVRPWRRWGLMQLLDKGLFLLVFLLGLDKDLLLLPLGLLLHYHSSSRLSCCMGLWSCKKCSTSKSTCRTSGSACL